MRFTYTQAFEQLSRRKQVGEKDVTDKFKVIGILRDVFGLHGLTDEIVQIDSDSYRLPDILIKATNPGVVIELEGGIHGNGDDVTKRDKDIIRDLDYKNAGYKLVLIYKNEKLGYETKEVIRTLLANGLTVKFLE